MEACRRTHRPPVSRDSTFLAPGDDRNHTKSLRQYPPESQEKSAANPHEFGSIRSSRISVRT